MHIHNDQRKGIHTSILVRLGTRPSDQILESVLVWRKIFYVAYLRGGTSSLAERWPGRPGVCGGRAGTPPPPPRVLRRVKKVRRGVQVKVGLTALCQVMTLVRRVHGEQGEQMPVNAFGSAGRGTRGGGGLMGQRERVRVNAFGYRGILPNRASQPRISARLHDGG